MPAAGDVGCRTGWHTPPEKGPGSEQDPNRMDIPREKRRGGGVVGEEVEMGPFCPKASSFGRDLV